MSRTVAACCLLLTAVPLALGVAAAGEGGSAAEIDPPQLSAQLARLVGQLDDDRFEVRRRAEGRLEAMVAKPELGRLLAAEFRRVLLRPEVSFEVRSHLEQWCRRLPSVPPEPVQEVSPEELERLLDQLDDNTYSVRVGAARRLESLLFRDENLPEMRRALNARAGAEADPETTARLRTLLDLAAPAMVAECWQGRRHVGEQHLLVGVPSLGPGATTSSHFDRIDEHVAHCVSGNNLAPGDYPVGVAFPHPKQPGAFFHLVNLPTPRRRWEYQQQLQTDEARRLAAISRRTLDRMLAERHELSERELLMLAQLDPKEVSRFAGEYFHLADDAPLPRSTPVAGLLQNRAGGRPSRFGLICVQLAVDGTREAIPGLLKAIEENRFLPPSAAAPCRLDWLAALSIAARDPWPEVDGWLGGLLGRHVLLVEGTPDAAQLGAIAAVVLLQRHGQSPSEFGIQSARSPAPRLGAEGYRFSSPEAQKKLQQWWQQEKKQKHGTATPGLEPHTSVLITDALSASDLPEGRPFNAMACSIFDPKGASEGMAEKLLVSPA